MALSVVQATEFNLPNGMTVEKVWNPERPTYKFRYPGGAYHAPDRESAECWLSSPANYGG